MKKILTLFAVVGMLVVQGCTTNDDSDYIDTDTDTISEAFEIRNVNLGRVADNEYNISSTFKFEVGGDLFEDETILVYRKTGAVSSGAAVWQLIPRTIYLDNGDELDYDYDFSKFDFIITARGTYNLLNTPSFIDNQTFRVVIIPSNLSLSVDKDNYLGVMKALNLNENKVQQIQL